MLHKACDALLYSNDSPKYKALVLACDKAFEAAEAKVDVAEKLKVDPSNKYVVTSAEKGRKFLQQALANLRKIKSDPLYLNAKVADSVTSQYRGAYQNLSRVSENWDTSGGDVDVRGLLVLVNDVSQYIRSELIGSVLRSIDMVWGQKLSDSTNKVLLTAEGALKALRANLKIKDFHKIVKPLKALDPSKEIAEREAAAAKAIRDAERAVADAAAAEKLKSDTLAIDTKDREKQWQALVAKMQKRTKKAISELSELPKGYSNLNWSGAAINASKGKHIDLYTKEHGGYDELTCNMVLAYGLGSALEARGIKPNGNDPKDISSPSLDYVEKMHQEWLTNPKWTKL